MIDLLLEKLKKFALADAIIEQEWKYRYFSYNAHWSDNEEMASLRDGCGGEWFLWLSDGYAGYKCVSPDDGLMGNIEEVKQLFPKEYERFITEPAFSMNFASYIWYWDGVAWVKNGDDVKSLINLDTVRN